MNKSKKDKGNIFDKMLENSPNSVQVVITGKSLLSEFKILLDREWYSSYCQGEKADSILKKLKQNKMKYTSENITHLEENEVFVFGSNKAGIHGAGAAYTARNLFGAKSGAGIGPTGSCYALPTKNEHFITMSLPEIEEEVQDLLRHAQVNKEQTFLITKIGCGLAGYKEEDIAPMFTEFLMLDNVTLPKEFCKIIKENLTF